MLLIMDLFFLMDWLVIGLPKSFTGPMVKQTELKSLLYVANIVKYLFGPTSISQEPLHLFLPKGSFLLYLQLIIELLIKLYIKF